MKTIKCPRCTLSLDIVESVNIVHCVCGHSFAVNEPKNSITAEAEEIINGARQQDYGSYKNEVARIAKFWSAITGYDIQPRHVPMMMITLKLCRQLNKNKRDNLVDIIGYTLLLEKLEDNYASPSNQTS